MNVNEYYISSIRICKDENGMEHISYVKVHAKYGAIVKKEGQELPIELVISLVSKKQFYSARWDQRSKKWVQGARIISYQSETGKYYIVPHPEDDINSLYDLPRF